MPIFLFVLLITLYLIQNWSKKNALKGINFHYKCTKQLVEPDESLEVVTTVLNQSSRLVPFLRLEEALPAETTILQDQILVRTNIAGKSLRHISSVYLMPKSKLERRLAISLPKRGCYLFRGADLTGGDFLGLNEERKTFSSLNEVVVYPKAANMQEVQELLGGFLGDVSVRRFMMEDPVLTAGARDYTGSEPLNQISWKHSARANKLMVKQFDYTLEPMVSVLLDVNMPEGDEGKAQVLEQCFSLTRSVCQQLEQKGIAYDFISNTTAAGVITKQQYLTEGLGKAHLSGILEKLGRASYLAGEPFATTAKKLTRRQEKNRSTIIIMPKRDEHKRQFAQQLQKINGGSLIFIYGEEHSDDISIRTETAM